MAQMLLYRRRGWGSALIEVQLAWYGMPVDLIEVGDVFRDAEEREKLIRINPAGQVPALVLPDGRLMTESAAITLHLADLAGSTDLVPEPAAPERAEFLRWLIFIVAQIYPCFTFGDAPARYVTDPQAQEEMQQSIFARAEQMWLALGQAASAAGPWFLGERFSALDLYLGVMGHWEPGLEWFRTHLPRVDAIRQAVQGEPRLAPAFAANFDD